MSTPVGMKVVNTSTTLVASANYGEGAKKLWRGKKKKNKTKQKLKNFEHHFAKNLNNFPPKCQNYYYCFFFLFIYF
jgi:hypothetical protein